MYHNIGNISYSVNKYLRNRLLDLLLTNPHPAPRPTILITAHEGISRKNNVSNEKKTTKTPQNLWLVSLDGGIFCQAGG